ncbi:MAG: glycosyltransferase [Cyclobacteriaceae bacterium]
MASPKISIITVTFNAELYLEPTIQSVISQNFESLEYIVVDGNSSDRTMDIIDKYHDKIDTLIRETDHGVYDAMNKGLKLAKGEYVLFLNAGDELASDKTLEKIFKQVSNPDLIYGETLIIDINRKTIGTRTNLTSRKLPEALSKRDFLNGQVVSHQSFIPKRSLCPQYDLQYRCSADIDWMLRIMSKVNFIHKSEESISKYLQGGISDRNLKTCWMERLNIMLKHFNPIVVMIKHIEFGIRYLRIGAYKNKP